MDRRAKTLGKQWQRGMSFLVLILLLLGPPAWAAPIRGLSPRTTFVEGTVLRTFGEIVHKEGASQELDIYRVPAIGQYQIMPDATIAVLIPYVEKRRKVTSGGTTSVRSTSGLGDVRVTGKYRFWHKDVPFGVTQAAVFGGLEVPTGSDSERDNVGALLPISLQLGSGSVDPFVGAAVGRTGRTHSLEGGAQYQINTKGEEFELGDEVRYDLTYQYQIFPPQIENSQLNLTVELNGKHVEKHELAGRKLNNSGGDTLFVAPGLQFLINTVIFEGSIQLPIFQDLNGTQPETDYNVLVGMRYLF
ncbi:MAG: transporter [bacterium]|nr:transporter [bacterium]